MATTGPKSPKKASKVRRQVSEPVVPVKEVPGPPVVVPPTSSTPDLRHDIFKNLATDTARRIVKDLDLDYKLRHYSKFGAKGKKDNVDADFLKS